MKQRALIDQPYEIVLPCIKVEQPIGVFFVASIDAKVLIEITFSDIRKMTGEREIDNYLGIQREVDPKRVKEIEKYVNTVDACFPTAVILAIPEQCAEFNAERNTLTLRSVHGENDEPIVNRVNIAKVLDGQHRIEGLKAFGSGTFEINVSIFVEMDLANQAYLFSTVNLAQTKVKKSLVYDLFEYSRSRSPQKSAHNIAVALDRLPSSPFCKRIKRLGSATPGRRGETLTQAAFVEAVMELMTADAVADRDLYKRGKRPARATPSELEKLIFRNLFLEEEDMKIADVLLAFFNAVREKWPVAWDNPDTGYMLAKTNGFRGLMRLLRPAYLHVAKSIGEVPSTETFSGLFARSTVKDEDFVITEFLPGTGGEARLFRTLRDQMLPPAGGTGLFR
jgi:DGQHR domain-containing protein